MLIFIQVSKIVGCELQRIGDLNYEFVMGACGTYNFPQERILLCFSFAKKSGCERFVILKEITTYRYKNARFSYDGLIFHNQADSKNDHAYSSLAKIDGAPLVVGCGSPYTKKAEILDISSNTWTEIADYPYHKK